MRLPSCFKSQSRSSRVSSNPKDAAEVKSGECGDDINLGHPQELALRATNKYIYIYGVYTVYIIDSII